MEITKIDTMNLVEALWENVVARKADKVSAETQKFCLFSLVSNWNKKNDKHRQIGNY